jgi:amino acid transporter
LFLTLSGVALLVLRRRHRNVRRPFRVPGYTLVPLAVIVSRVYVCWSSVAYVRIGAVVGLAVLPTGALSMAALRAVGERGSKEKLA